MLRLWGSRLHFNVTNENKGLAKTNSQAQVPARYIFENIQRNVALPRDFVQITQSRPTPGMMHQGTDQQIKTFPVFLLWSFALPCYPAPTPLGALVLTQPHFFSTYYVMHTVLHLLNRYVALEIFIKCDAYINLYAFSLITLVIKKFIYCSHAFYSSPQSLRNNFAVSAVRCLFCPSLAQ